MRFHLERLERLTNEREREKRNSCNGVQSCVFSVKIPPQLMGIEFFCCSFSEGESLLLI